MRLGLRALLASWGGTAREGQRGTSAWKGSFWGTAGRADGPPGAWRRELAPGALSEEPPGSAANAVPVSFLCPGTACGFLTPLEQTPSANTQSGRLASSPTPCWPSGTCLSGDQWASPVWRMTVTQQESHLGEAPKPDPCLDAERPLRICPAGAWGWGQPGAPLWGCGSWKDRVGGWQVQTLGGWGRQGSPISEGVEDSWALRGQGCGTKVRPQEVGDEAQSHRVTSGSWDSALWALAVSGGRRGGSGFPDNCGRSEKPRDVSHHTASSGGSGGVLGTQLQEWAR